MKKFFTIIVLLAAEVSLFTLQAQDDMYFMPSKSDIQKQKEEKKTGITGYYSGISKTDDQYNRRTGKDSLADDVIVFNVGKPSTNNNMEDIVYNFGDSTVQSRDVDYKLSRRISRFDDYYYGWYDPWFCSRYYWGRPWFYGPYWYGPWYDPWYDPWFYGYYDPYYFRYTAFWGWPYDPWFYGPRWYGPGWYGPGYYRPYVVVRTNYRPGYGPRNDAQRHDSHFYANHSSSSSSIGHRSGGRSGIASVASRNGDAITRSTGHSYQYAERNSGWNRNSSFERGFDNSGFSQSRSFSGGSGFSGGGGFSHGGGGGFSGGGGHSGAHHR